MMLNIPDTLMAFTISALVGSVLSSLLARFLKIIKVNVN